MKYLLLLIILSGCIERSGIDNVIYWQDVKDPVRKEACRKCSIDADIKDCNKCAF